MPAEATHDYQALAANIYVHTQAFNSSMSSWAVIIDRQGKLTKLHGKIEDGDAQRLLLTATITAIESLPPDLPLKVSSASEYLTRWVLGRLVELHQGNYGAGRKKKLANPDLIKRLYQLSLGRPYLQSIQVRAGEWPEMLTHTAELAWSYGGAKGFQGRATAAPKPKVVVTPSKPLSAALVAPQAVPADLPWD